MTGYQNNVNVAEKVISVFSYLTMGIVGLLWIISAYFLKKRIKFFLMYNIVQSMFISILLSFFKLLLELIFSIFGGIKFLSFITSILNFLFVKKLIFVFSLSFSLLETVLFLLLTYIIIGVCLGRIFKVPFFTKIMKRLTANY